MKIDSHIAKLPDTQNSNVNKNKTQETNVYTNTNTNSPAHKLNLSNEAQSFNKALKLADSEELVRTDIVEKAKDILENWQEPNDEQLNIMFQGILEDN